MPFLVPHEDFSESFVLQHISLHVLGCPLKTHSHFSKPILCNDCRISGNELPSCKSARSLLARESRSRGYPLQIPCGEANFAYCHLCIAQRPFLAACASCSPSASRQFILVAAQKVKDFVGDPRVRGTDLNRRQRSRGNCSCNVSCCWPNTASSRFLDIVRMRKRFHQ